MAGPERICSRCGASYGADVLFCPKDGIPLGAKTTEAADDPYLGLTLDGEYELQQLIGIGAMGRVYRAHQRGIERAVAVKVLHRELLKNPSLVARFLREARVASRLAHPGVVQMFSTGEIEGGASGVGGEAYLVMEYLDGISLRSALAASGGSLPLPRALHILLQLCDAVGEAHAAGIVHRDLKPENVMLVQRGDDADYVKVLDFGVARMQTVEASVATQAGVIFGTARYVSPEAAQAKSVSPASDVYSLGIIAFECLSGRTPFEGDNPVQILIQHTQAAPPSLRSIPRATYVPEPLATVIDASLSKSPSARSRDAHELARALRAAARQSGVSPEDLGAASSGISAGAKAFASIQRTKSLGVPEPLAGRSATSASAPTPADDDLDEALPAPPMTAMPRWLLIGLFVVVVVVLGLLAARHLGAFAALADPVGRNCRLAASAAGPWDAVASVVVLMGLPKGAA
jgi:serine/threonine protein kinase